MSQFPVTCTTKPIPIEDRRTDGEMVVSSTDSSPCGTPPTSSSDLLRTYFNFGKVSEDPVRVTPTDFMKLITESDDKSIDMAIFLILINGLPQCHKSDVLKKFLNEIPNAYSQDSQSQHGLSYHELTAVEIPEQGRLHVPTLAYNITTSEDCYLYAMKSALKQVGDGKPIQYNDAERGLPIDTAFKDKDLNAHFYDMFSKLKKEGLSSNWGSQGVALFNLWDIGHSRTVYNFLPALHGVLHNSYSWLFFDLERDSKSLYKPPEVNPSNCHENLMKTRPRLHYLMRSAKINFPANKRVCLMFATHSGEIEESERKRIIRSIRGDFESVATKIGVKSLIDFNSIIMVEPNDHTACARIVTEKMDGLVHKALQNKCSVLFSFIFLRSFYYKNNSIIYTKKEEVERLADELKMSKKQFDEFCKLFTSFGSFIDVSLIDQDSQFIIMKPNLFIKELDKIFHTDNPALANTGILTLSTAQSLFGEPHATAYMDITVSFGIAVRLTKEQVELPISLNDIDDNSVLYCPNIRTTTPCTESKSTHLRLLRSWDAPPDNLMTSFVAEFLKLSPNSKVIIDNNTPSNVTKMKAYETSGKTPIEFEIVYFGYTLEFRIQTATEGIFSQIIRTCHKVMHQEPRTKTKYNFAVMCSKDPQRTKVMYELTRERHLLPCDISMCDECRKEKRHENPVFTLWNKVAQDRKDDIQLERRLNGDPMTLDDAHFVVKELENIDPVIIKRLALKLGINQEDYDKKFAGLKKWMLLMSVVIEWGRAGQESLESLNKESASKTTFARKLVELANELSKEGKTESELLRDTAIRLNDEVIDTAQERVEGYMDHSIEETK